MHRPEGNYPTLIRDLRRLKDGPNIIATALNTARQRGAEYADVRLVSNREQRIVVRNGVVETMTADESVGLGIRALYNGAWGFASTRELTNTGADEAAGQAVQIARASASQNGAGLTAAPTAWRAGGQPGQLHHSHRHRPLYRSP